MKKLIDMLGLEKTVNRKQRQMECDGQARNEKNWQ